MKESSWKDCLDFADANRISIDKEKSKSLIETSKDRIKCAAKEVNEQNANFVFEDYYSSIVELIHSIVILEGFKVNNHICLGYYLKDVLKREDLYLFFDDIRYKRNSLTYYGRRMDFETAKQAINKSKIIIKELMKLLEDKKVLNHS